MRPSTVILQTIIFNDQVCIWTNYWMCIFNEISSLKSMKYDIPIHASWMKFWSNDGQWILERIIWYK